MLLPALVLLLQAAPPPAADRPIRVWLGSEQPVAAGAEVQVFVRTAVDGYLTVLRRTTTGRIEVLFPAAPGDETFVPRGSYEVRNAADGAAFAALEPPGTGLVLAALSTTPLRTREFALQAAAWNPEALAPSWQGADAEGALTDIVQRMLGDGYFAYDLVPYTVAPPGAAPLTPLAWADGAQEFGTCVGCAFTTIIIVDDFFFPHHRRFDRRRPKPALEPQDRVLGIPRRGAPPPGVVTRAVERPGFTIPRRPAAPPPIAARPRTVAERSVPALRGRRPPRPAIVSASSAAQRRTARLVMPATPTPPARPPAVVPAALVPAAPGDVPARTRAAAVAAAVPDHVVPVTRPAGTPVAPRPRATAGAAGVAPARPPTAASSGTRPAAGGQVRARSRGATQVTGTPGGAQPRARVRAGVPARKRQ